MENQNQNTNTKANKAAETDKKLDKMRIEISDSEKCKMIARKLTAYIKDTN